MKSVVEDEIDLSTGNEDKRLINEQQVVYDTDILDKTNICKTYYEHKTLNCKFSTTHSYYLQFPLKSIPEDIVEISNRVVYESSHGSIDIGLIPTLCVYRYRTCWVFINLWEHRYDDENNLIFYRLTAAFASDVRADLEESLSALHERLPIGKETQLKKNIPKTQVCFCKLNKSDGKVTFIPKSSKTPPWDSIRKNYPTPILKQLDNLFANDDLDLRKGKLIIWSGGAGTGKTNALRSLAHHLQGKNQVFYITDIENFFDSTDYLLKLDYNPPFQQQNKDKNHFIILEDAGEFLVKNAKDRIGQGFSRLLNMADGMLGETYKVIFIITTNENLDDLHPAVTRSGRATSIINFPLFTEGEANSWLEAQKCDRIAKGPMSLADLYAIVRKDEDIPITNNKPIGFMVDFENSSYQIEKEVLSS